MKTKLIITALMISGAAFAQKSENPKNEQGMTVNTTAQSETGIRIRETEINSEAFVQAQGSLKTGETTPAAEHAKKSKEGKAAEAEQVAETKALVKAGARAQKEEREALENHVETTLSSAADISRSAVRTVKSEIGATQKATVDVVQQGVRSSVNAGAAAKSHLKLQSGRLNAAGHLHLNSKLRAL